MATILSREEIDFFLKNSRELSKSFQGYCLSCATRVNGYIIEDDKSLFCPNCHMDFVIPCEAIQHVDRNNESNILSSLFNIYMQIPTNDTYMPRALPIPLPMEEEDESVFTETKQQRTMKFNQKKKEEDESVFNETKQQRTMKFNQKKKHQPQDKKKKKKKEKTQKKNHQTKTRRFMKKQCDNI